MAEKQSIKRFIVRDPHGHIEQEDSFSVVGEVHVDIVPGYGEPYAESEYVNGILTITIHNIEGNGITEITTDSQEGDEAVNTVTIKTNDNPEGTNFQVLNGSRGNSITEITQTTVATEDGGKNIVNIKTTDNPQGVNIEIKNGSQGRPGADRQPVETGDVIIAHGTGDSEEQVMSQKAVTKQVTIIKDTITAEQIEALNNSRIIYNDTWYQTSSGSNGRLIDISSHRGEMIKIVSNENYGARIAFFDAVPENNKTVPYCQDEPALIDSLQAGEEYSTIVPTDCVYLYLRHERSGNILTPSSVNFLETIKERVSALGANISSLQGEMSNIEAKTRVTLKELTAQQIKDNYNVYWYIGSDVWNSTDTNNNARKIAFAEYAGKKIEVVTGAKQAHVAFIKSNPSNYGDPVAYCDDTELVVLSANTTTVLDIPSDCNYLYVRAKHGGQDWVPTTITVFNGVAEEVSGVLVEKPTLIYLSKDGSDDNDGKTSSTPKATFTAAINAGGKDLRIVLMSDIKEKLDLSSWNGRKSHLEIIGQHGGIRRIIRGKFLDDLEPYEGYDDVYTWTPAEGESIVPPSTYTYAWLWQHEIPDASTLIPANERHPLQRGRTYRRLSTCLKRVNSLETLLSSETPCWYGDYTNNVLYLRAVSGSDVAENPIVVPSANGIAIQGGNYPITLINVEAWYGSIVTSNNFVAKDCAARYNMYEGAWEIDNSKSVYLLRCEADSNTMPGTITGDGFNLHPTHNSGDDPLAKAGTHTLVDCWSHDNRDDGYSDHGKSEGTIIGGLYEHNGKAGLVPAYGAHDTIYNTTCQKNSRGITCLGGQTQDGGNGTQVACYGCVCDSNYYNFSSQGKQGEQVRFILNNCISRNATNTAIIAEQYVEVVVRDCTDSGSPTVKSASSGAVITIDNGNLIS